MAACAAQYCACPAHESRACVSEVFPATLKQIQGHDVCRESGSVRSRRVPPPPYSSWPTRPRPRPSSATLYQNHEPKRSTMVKRGLKVLAMTSTAAFALRSVVFITPPRQQARRIQPPIDGEMARQHWIALVVFRAPVRSAALCRAGPSPNLRCRGTAWQASEFMFSTRELGAIQIASCVHHGTTDKILCND